MRETFGHFHLQLSDKNEGKDGEWEKLVYELIV